MIGCERCSKRETTQAWERELHETTCHDGRILCGACVDEIIGRDGFVCPFCDYRYDQDTRSDEEQEREPHVRAYVERFEDDQEDAAHERQTDVLTILNDSDAVCSGCGADPRDLWKGLEGRGFITDGRRNPLDVCRDEWYFHLDDDASTAEVLCPPCLAAEVFVLPEVTR